MGAFLPLARELLFEAARALANFGEMAQATDTALEACCIFLANNMMMHFQSADVLDRALSFFQKRQPLRIEK